MVDTATVLTEPPYHSERRDGREVQKPLPNNLHAFIQTSLVVRLAGSLPKMYRAAMKLNVLCSDDRPFPDVTVMTRSALFHDGDLPDPPILAVEISSPGQMIGELFNKCDRLLKAGTQTCWVAWPERRQAWIYTGDLLPEAKEELVVQLRDTHDQVSVSLAELWAELE